MAFPPEIEAFVEQPIAGGQFESPQQLIITAVGLLRERDEEITRLRAEIEKGWDGPGIPAAEVFAQMRSRFNLFTPHDSRFSDGIATLPPHV